MTGGGQRDEDADADAGLAMRRQILGDEHVDRALADATSVTAPWQDHLARHVWGASWTRPELDLRTRSCITIALLAALRAHDELPLHVRAALRNGVTPAEIAEILLHTAVYAGAPAANAAFAVAQQALDEPPPPDAERC